MTWAGRAGRQTLARVAAFVGGVLCIGVGAGATIWVGVGVGPFDVVYTALVDRYAISLTVAVWIVGGVAVLAALALGGRLGAGTVLLPLLAGPASETALALLSRSPSPAALPAWAVLGAGIFIIGIGAALVVSADLGAGAPELAAIAIAGRVGRPHRWPTVRGAIEAFVLAVGVVLGGAFGWGTLAFVALIGPAVALGVRVTRPLQPLLSGAH